MVPSLWTRSDITNSRVEASIEAASITTRDEQRDGHLKSADFFDVEKFPTLSFKSTRISRTGDEELAVTGDLTFTVLRALVVFNVEGPTVQPKIPGATLAGVCRRPPRSTGETLA
jgi:polyisoprenoid-binding protein YceI